MKGMKVPSHGDLKRRALARPGVRAEYDRLGSEFARRDRILNARRKARRTIHRHS